MFSTIFSMITNLICMLQIAAAIASSLWMSYQQNQAAITPTSQLTTLMLQCEVLTTLMLQYEARPHVLTIVQKGKMIVLGVVEGLLLCMSSDDSVGFGMLKAKVRVSCF